MTSQLYYSPFIPAFSSNGAPVAGALLNFYLTGTTTRTPIYADSTLTTELTNPVVADAAAKYPTIYLDDTVTYKVVQTDADGVQIGDALDPYVPGRALKGDPGSPGEVYSTRTALKAAAASATNLSVFYLTENGREGKFIYKTGDYSSEVTADTQEGIYMQAGSIPTTTGALVRQYDGLKNANWFGIAGDNSEETTTIQAAVDTIDSLQDSDTLFFPEGDYRASALDFKSLNVIGVKGRRGHRGAFGSSNYDQSAGFFTGTVFYLTGTTGNCVTIGIGQSQTVDFRQIKMENLTFVGPGSGTSKGLYCQGLLSGQWTDVFVANFHRGIDFDWFEDNNFYSLRCAGCEEGIWSDNTANNQNCFYGIELQRCEISLYLGDRSTLNCFFGGVMQGGSSDQDHTIILDGANNNLFQGIWFEHEPVNAAIEIKNGSSLNMFLQNRWASFPVTFDIQTNSGQNYFMSNEGQSGSITVDIASGAALQSFFLNSGLTINDSAAKEHFEVEDGIISAHEYLLELNRGQTATNASRARMKSTGISTAREYHWAFLDETLTELFSLVTNNQNLLAMRVGATDQHTWLVDGRYEAQGRVKGNYLQAIDGISVPTTEAGVASIFVDSADGDLKIKFGDGTVKTIVTDT